MTPRFIHDYDHMVFCGRINNYDIWHDNVEKKHCIVARYGDEPSEYVSCTDFDNKAWAWGESRYYPSPNDCEIGCMAAVYLMPFILNDYAAQP